jgi:drug/metabolite transporter (DMT)-like permease
LPLCLPLCIWEFSIMDRGPFTWKVIEGVLFLGLIATALAMILWNKAFTLLGPSVAILTFFARPVVGSTLGIVFLGETVSPLLLLGGMLIGLGLVIASRQ